MMKGTIQNKDSFLAGVAEKLARPQKTSVEKPQWKYSPQRKVLLGATADELLDVLRKQCEQIHTDLVETTLEKLPETLYAAVKTYGGGPVSIWDDERFSEYGLTESMNTAWKADGIDVHTWDASQGDRNIEFAERANIGITFSDATLAESGTVVLFSSSGKGRSVSLLPESYIAIIPKSTLVPRITQAADIIRKQLDSGRQVPSCINFITGPSNSADIEMNLVIGVHGPVRAAYIVVDDQ